MLTNIDEAKIKDTGVTLEILTKSFPLEVIFTNTSDNVFLTANAYDMTTFVGQLDDKKFKNFKKEMKGLFTDFDDIFEEILKRYGLVRKK